jgi:hypothetical protein
MTELLDLVLEAHGGQSRWMDLSAITARVRYGGLAFRSRLCFGTQRWRRVEVDPHAPRVTFGDYPSRSTTGHFDQDRVWLTDGEGVELRSRDGARARMGTWRRQLWWDSLDLLYFSGYALWNYLTTPFLLAAPGVESREGPTVVESDRRLRTLDVRFPAEIPTHSPEQRFYYDERFLLCRHDYDPLAFASWARAAHLCDEHEVIDGLPVPVRRHVVPRRPDGGFRPAPTLLWIELAEVELRRGRV